ncbi:unnamed protein product [Bubo scandiacus]
MLSGSICSQLLEQNTLLRHALDDVERQCGALEMENSLLRKKSSPEACKEAERLQQKNAKLAALTKQLKERCRHLQETIKHLINTPVNEDGWYVGELVDGTRGLISFNFAEEVSDDDLENRNWNDPHYILGLSPIVEEEEDLDVGSGG